MTSRAKDTNPVQQASSPEPFITVKDVAQRLFIKPTTVYEWTRRRSRDEQIPHYPVSRKVVLFRWSEVVRWVEDKKVA